LGNEAFQALQPPEILPWHKWPIGGATFLQGRREEMLTLRALGNPEVQVNGTVVSFPTRHAAQALFSLALAPTNQFNVEELGERLWPEALTSRLQQSMATMTWQLRKALGPEAWRISRSGDDLLFKSELVTCDLWSIRLQAFEHLADGFHDKAILIDRLREPLLSPWQHEAWVRYEQRLINRLVKELQE